MALIGVRQLCRKTTEVFEELERTGTPVVIARHGKPIAALIQVDESQLNELILAAAPEFVASRREADEALARGDVQPMSEVIAESSDSGAPEHVVEPHADMLAQLVGRTIFMPEYEQVIESISRAAVDGAPIELGTNEAEQISAVNEELTRTVFAEALWTAASAALERVRLMNERVAERAAHADAPAESYAQLLDQVAEVEQLSAPVAGPSGFITNAISPGGFGKRAHIPQSEVDSPAEAPSTAGQD